jgi:hypothetical protein
MQFPKTQARRFAAFQILDTLGYNPSYIELCELIEGIGFGLDRARFALALLAAIPSVNDTPEQPVESRVPQICNKQTTSNEYQPINSDFSITKGSLSIMSSNSTPSILTEAHTQVEAPLQHPESAQKHMKLGSGGPGSRVLYRKTRKRMSEAPKSPSNLEPRRRPGRPRKHWLTPNQRVSNGAPDGNYPINPALAKAQNLEAKDRMLSAKQLMLKASLNARSDDIEDRLVFALTG